MSDVLVMYFLYSIVEKLDVMQNVWIFFFVWLFGIGQISWHVASIVEWES